jgi:hypothetical protein
MHANRALCAACVLVSNAAFAEDEVAPEPISTSLVVLGAGASFDGPLASLAIGWGWGSREPGILPSSDVVRLLAGATLRRTAPTGTLTLGWYTDTIIDLGFDGGVAVQRDAIGPAMRITLGTQGVGARFSAAAMLSSGPVVLDASIELVVDVKELASRFQ